MDAVEDHEAEEEEIERSADPVGTEDSRGDDQAQEEPGEDVEAVEGADGDMELSLIHI